ncbi:uncharacterized protein EDB91DRAFT_619767 [Suillus paluster]|uniref:uncharacterized protein n=1 Tax=Suillus paluster TaxID=48578 RepID=UPI001B86F564|nr:uncharacterized protein EDB91DRAFT_619767 [Suillus paluster]KAG1734037.1 hypothetical protein EDB91DRAFT_619767 [Suillus paluster]
MESDQDVVSALFWNNTTSVAIATLISYEYILQFDKEVKFVWERQWSLMTYLYLAVRYLGLFLALVCAFWGGLLYMPERVSYVLALLMEWGFSAYFCLAEVILICRLYALSNQSRVILYVLLGLFIPIVALSIGMDVFLYSRPAAFSVKEIITPQAKYCTSSFNMGPMPAIYASIPILIYDIFLVVLAVTILVKHLKERREIRMRPNIYVLMIVRYHIIYFVLNLTNQILLAVLWANIPTAAMSLSQMFIDTAPFIIAPRLIISIWDMHVDEECVRISTAFADCVCWTSPPPFEQHEMDSHA